MCVLNLVLCWKHSGVNDYAAQITVEEDPAVRHGADSLEKVQNPRSHVRAEPLVKVLFCHHGQQASARLAVWVEALADIHGVGDTVLLVAEAQRLQEGCDVSGRAVLGDGADAELFFVRLPQGFKPSVLWQVGGNRGHLRRAEEASEKSVEQR